MYTDYGPELYFLTDPAPAPLGADSADAQSAGDEQGKPRAAVSEPAPHPPLAPAA